MHYQIADHVSYLVVATARWHRLEDQTAKQQADPILQLAKQQLRGGQRGPIA